jgi:hypothetical protein
VGGCYARKHETFSPSTIFTAVSSVKAKFHNPLLLPTNLIFHQKIMKTRKLDIIEVGSGKMERKKLLHGKEMAQIK